MPDFTAVSSKFPGFGAQQRRRHLPKATQQRDNQSTDETPGRQRIGRAARSFDDYPEKHLDWNASNAWVAVNNAAANQASVNLRLSPSRLYDCKSKRPDNPGQSPVAELDGGVPISQAKWLADFPSRPLNCARPSALVGHPQGHGTVFAPNPRRRSSTDQTLCLAFSKTCCANR